MLHRRILISLFAVALTVSASAETILPDFQANSLHPNHAPQQHPYSVADSNAQIIYAAFGSQRDGLNWDIALARFDYEAPNPG